MKKVVIVYYSGTGNTQMMADALFEALQHDAVDVTLYHVSETQVDEVKDADVFILGCPAMGVEELEEYEFRPFFDDLKPYLEHKDVVLFGSYDWGDQGWMRSWEEELKALNASVCGVFTEELSPDEESLKDLQVSIRAIFENIT